MDFASITPAQLDRADLDALDFGVVKMDRSCVVTFYNTAETEISGLSKERVEGRSFFEEVAPCMNNFMVSQKFLDPGDLDEILDYVLTLRMDPTDVKLRLLREGDGESQYLLVTHA